MVSIVMDTTGSFLAERLRIREIPPLSLTALCNPPASFDISLRKRRASIKLDLPAAFGPITKHLSWKSTSKIFPITKHQFFYDHSKISNYYVLLCKYNNNDLSILPFDPNEQGNFCSIHFSQIHIVLHKPALLDASVRECRPGSLRETFFLYSLKPDHTVTYSRHPGFLVNGEFTFEFECRSKDFSQIKMSKTLLSCLMV